MIFSAFVLMLFSSHTAEAEHKQYQYDESLSAKENYKRAGHEEDYEKFKEVMLDENKSSDEKNTEVENYVKGFVPDWLQEDIKETISDIQKEDSGFSDEETEKVENLLESEPEYIIKDGKYQGDTSGGKFTYTLLQSLPKEGDDLSENVTLEQYLTWAFRFVLALAGFLAVMMIVIGGVEYIISGASESMRGEAKKRIENAIWGLVMALVSYLVLYTINPSLVDFNSNQFFKEKETTTTTDDTSTKEDGNADTDTNNVSESQNEELQQFEQDMTDYFENRH